MGDSGDVAAFLATHDGIITAPQAYALGLSREEIRGRVARGEWLVPARGIYRSAANDYSEAAMVRMVVLAYRGVADRGTAAWWHGMLTELPVGITLSCRSARTDLPSSVPVRATRRSYDPRDVRLVRDLAVTAKPLTALMTTVDLPDGTAFLDRMLQVGAVDLAGLQRAADDHAGMRGIGMARRILAVASSDSESEAERLFVRLLEERGVTGWVQQYRTGRWRLDFAWPERRVAVEISGRAFHRTSRRHGNDLAKANHLEHERWRELQFDWHMLNDSGAGCVQQVIDLLNASDHCAS